MTPHLQLTRVDNGGLLAVLDGTAGGTGGLDGLDNSQTLIIGNLAENDVAAVQPGSRDGGDEELGPVAVGTMLAIKSMIWRRQVIGEI